MNCGSLTPNGLTVSAAGISLSKPLQITAWVDMEESKTNTELSKIPVVKLDPAHPLTLTQGSGVLNGVFCATYNQKRIQFPEPSFKLDKLLTTRRLEDFEEDFDEEDRSIFE